MSYNKDEWYLIEWRGGDFSVIHSKEVVNSISKRIRVGNNITAYRGKKLKTGQIIASADERVKLDRRLEYELAYRSKQIVEDLGGYISSGSSWIPSDNEDTSSGTDYRSARRVLMYNNSQQDCTRNKKYMKYKKIVTMPPRKLNNKKSYPVKKVENVKSNKYNDKGSSNIKSNRKIAEATKQNITENVGNNRLISVSLNKVLNLRSYCHHLMRIMTDLKQVFEIKNTIEKPVRTEEELKIAEIMINLFSNGQATANKKIMDDTKVMDEDKDKKNDKAIENDKVKEVEKVIEIVKNKQNDTAMKHDGQYIVNEEFDRSDDNVLITNKHDIQNKTKAGTVNNTLTPENANAGADEWVPIGSGKTLVHRDSYKKVNWKSYTVATRTLLLAVFPRKVLATHSLTGKSSPAFQNKPAKMCLDPKTVSDVIIEIMDKCHVKRNIVRSIITTKCADECKMWRMRAKKLKCA